MSKNILTVTAVVSLLLISFSVVYLVFIYIPNNQRKAELLKKETVCVAKADKLYDELKHGFDNTGTSGIVGGTVDHASSFIAGKDTCYLYYSVSGYATGLNIQSYFIKDIDSGESVASYVTTNGVPMQGVGYYSKEDFQNIKKSLGF